MTFYYFYKKNLFLDPIDFAADIKILRKTDALQIRLNVEVFQIFEQFLGCPLLRQHVLFKKLDWYIYFNVW